MALLNARFNFGTVVASKLNLMDTRTNTKKSALIIQKAETISELEIHKKMESIRATNAASFSEDEQHSR